MTIQGKTIVINGNVFVKDNSKLFFKDSELVFKQSYNLEHYFVFEGNATFDVDHVIMPDDASAWSRMDFHNSGKITFNKFKYPNTLWMVTYGDSTLNFTDSSVSMTFIESSKASLTAINPDTVWIEMGLPQNWPDGRTHPTTFEFDNIPNDSSGNWSSPANFPYNIQIVNAQKIQSIDFLMQNSNMHVIVRNSQNVKFGWQFYAGYGEKCAIKGLKNMYYSDKTFTSGEYTIPYPDGSSPFVQNSSIRFINSTVHNWWPFVYYGYTLELDDCDLADPYAGDAVININNSNIIYFRSSGNSTVTISNSTIQDSIVLRDTSFMDLQNVNFSGRITKDPTAKLRRDGAFYP